MSQQWHVVAYCRLRQAYRNFRLDCIKHLTLGEETVAARPQTLQYYWIDEVNRRSKEKVVIRFQAADVLPALSQHLQDTKHQYGWTHETLLPDGSVEMTFLLAHYPTSPSGCCPTPVPLPCLNRANCSSN